MSRADKMYKGSPRLERDDEGRMGVTKKQAESADVASGVDGVHIHESHAASRRSMHHRHMHEHMQLHHEHELSHASHKGDKEKLHEKHEKEYSDMHGRHSSEMKKLHDSHEKDGSAMINKVERNEKE